MIKIENTKIVGLEPAIRGMRNPMNSWDKSDSGFGCEVSDCNNCDLYELDFKCHETPRYIVGSNDLELMTKLANGGSVHAKYRRMIIVHLDIIAPLYWWKEFDTYKVGTVANSCSTMHKIHTKEFTLNDFSHEHLADLDINIQSDTGQSVPCMHHFDESLRHIISDLNVARRLYLQTNEKRYWWQMIQLLPSSYNQRRTVMLNYEVLVGIYKHRKDHKLDEWRDFCKWIETLPYSEIITPKTEDNTGKWLDIGSDIKCSACGAEFSGEISYMYRSDEWQYPKFCPNCGIKMVIPDES